MFRDSNELSLTRQPPGMLPPWAELVVGAACIITFAAVSLGSQLLWDQLPAYIDLGWFRNGLTFFVTFWMLASLLPPWRMSRMLRVAVLLPLAHVITIGFAWPVWTAVSAYVRDADATTVLTTKFAIAPAVVATTVLFIGIAGLAAKRRSGEWIHGFAMLALAELLLLGLWIPVACSMFPGGHSDWWSASEPLFADAVTQIAATVAPPTIAAVAFTVFALRRPQSLHAWRDMFITSLAVLLLVAIYVRAHASGRVLLLYSNFLPVLLVAAVVATSSLVTLGAVTWWRSWSSQRSFIRRERRGATIARDHDDAVIGLEITSWLRGPRVVQRQFVVSTNSGSLPVLGAQLVAAMPAATTQLRTGEVLAVLRPGDDVQIAGIDTAGGDPFRTSAAPLANDIHVAPAAMDAGGFASAALVMWRPCVAYLLIVTTVALPALAALLAT